MSHPATTAHNTRSSENYSLKWTIAVGLIIFVVLISNIALRFGINKPPSATGDEPSYDSIAWELANHRGFREDFSVPEFRSPYDTEAIDQPELMKLPQSEAGLVTHRPPLFPGILSLFNQCFGRQFFAARILNCFLMAATGASVFFVLARRYGKSTALVTVLVFLILDFRVRLYSRALLTESLSIFLAMALTASLWKLAQTPNWKIASLTGLIFGLCIQCRSVTILWLPGLAVLFLLLLRAKSLRHGGTALIATCLVCLPWGIRNIVVLDRLMPLGAQGMMEISAGFSDEAFRRKGVWFPLDQVDFFKSVEADHDTRLQREIARADYSRRQATEWIRRHPTESFQLGAMKIWNEYRPRNSVSFLIFILSLAGWISSAHQCESRIVAGLHAANALSIAATWSVEGRFVVPLLFGTYLMAGAGIRLVLQLCSKLPNALMHRSGGPFHK
ncbi:MAG: glycosyltransferase family 39 protein [Planctomyces sp.]|nr:glycosyltransferase family 39 protein [Planctomyces sp.]